MSRLLFVSVGAYKHDVAAATQGADSHGLLLKITSTHGVRRPESKRVRAVKTDCRVIRQQAVEDRRQADGKVRHKVRKMEMQARDML